jgi:hypothetical protein
MPRIMIRCRPTYDAIPTGLTTETVILDSLRIPIGSRMMALTARCGAYQQIRTWARKDAWVEEAQ